MLADLGAILSQRFPLSISSTTALVFLITTFPICVWVAWSDMSRMKIPNMAVYALFGLFVVLGLFLLPFSEYLWRFAQAFGVLVVGFVMNVALRMVGAGDAKFAAAMAPFVDPRDPVLMLMVYASVLLAAFATHRLFRAVPAMRAGFPGWKSWENPKFPMGLALAGSLSIYFVLGALFGA
ncbi:MAG: prepilin peptidase [Pseudomonadota bacterium]